MFINTIPWVYHLDQWDAQKCDHIERLIADFLTTLLGGQSSSWTR